MERLLSDDPHDRVTAEQTHPADWPNPTPAARYDLIVIGGGTAGLVAAGTGSVLGARVALVERAHTGGDCLIAGCVPSKALLRCAAAAAAARSAGRFGVDAAVAVDFAGVMAHVRAARSTVSRHDAARSFAADYGVDVFFGHGRFAGPDRLAVGDAVLRFRRAVIATGSRPALPDVPGLADAACLTNETVFNLARLPGRLVVLGGGPLGCEFAQAFARLGSAVTLIDRGPRLLSRDDPAASAVVLDALRRDGVTVRLNASADRVSRRADVTLVTVAGEAIPADAVLAATGRRANVTDLDPGAAGVALDRNGSVRVDDTLRTTNRRIFAAGDVCLAERYTHAADASARVAAQNALVGRTRRWSARPVPHVTYTDPAVAQVGPVDAAGPTYTVPLSDVDRAVTDGATEGFLRITTARRSGRIVAATIVAPRAGELIAVVATAMAAGLRLEALADVMFPYPTEAGGIARAADAALRHRLSGWPLRVVGWWVRRGRR